MSGETFSLKRKHVEVKKDELTASASSGHSESGSHEHSTQTHNNSDDKEKGYGYGCYLPLIIFIVLFIIFGLLIMCTGCDYGSYSDGCSGYHLAGAAILFFIVWILILWFFCRSGDSTMGWFFLLLIIALAIIWAFSCFLNKISC